MPKYQVEKSISIQSTPEQVYALVADFNTWTSWSPWLLVEPNATVTVSPNANSVGSLYKWDGDITGSGEVEHKRLEASRTIEEELRFLKPFKSTCQVIFAIAPDRGMTKLTWTMNGKMPWFLFFLLPMMKTFLGMDFQRGLNMIRDIIENGKVRARSESMGVQSTPAIRMAGIVGSCAVDSVGPALDAAMGEAEKEFRLAGVQSNQPMVCVYTHFHIKKGRFEYICGYMLPEGVTLKPGTKLKEWSQPAGRAMQVKHTGSYLHLGNAWYVATQLARKEKLKQCKSGTYEIYRNSPEQTAEEALVTEIYLPLK